MQSPKTSIPFQSDAEYLACEFEFLRARAARISAEKSGEIARKHEECGDAQRPGRTSSREARCRALELRQQEEGLRAEIDARLAVHRADESAPKLGLDKLCGQHSLDERERLLLLAVAVPGVHHRIADEVFGELIGGFGPLTISEAITMLDPQGVGDWLSARKLFWPDAKLRKAGVVVLDIVRGLAGPQSLMVRDVTLSFAAWATLIGVSEAAAELDGAAT